MKIAGEKEIVSGLTTGSNGEIYAVTGGSKTSYRQNPETVFVCQGMPTYFFHIFFFLSVFILHNCNIRLNFGGDRTGEL